MNYGLIYLIAINVVSFVMFALFHQLEKKSQQTSSQMLFALLSVIGGGLGVVLSMLIFDRKPVKENMMSRMIVVCFSVIEVFVILMLCGICRQPLTFKFGEFFRDHWIFDIYLAVMTVLTFVLFGIDKSCAIHQKRRIPILVLLGCSLLGGSLGGLSGMLIFRHKTQKNYFYLGLPMMMVVQLFVIFFCMNLPIAS